MSDRPILILCALQREAKAIAAACGAMASPDGAWHTRDATVRVVGLKGARLSRTPKPADDTIVIVAGLGGGLDPALASGVVVIDDPSGLLPEKPPDTRPGKIATSPVVLDSPAAKRETFTSTGALCVDMEQGVVQAWLGRPVVGLRVIFDDAHTSLPPEISAISDEVGGVRVGPLATFLLSNTRAVPTLMRLGRESSRLLGVLGKAAATTIEIASRSRPG